MDRPVAALEHVDEAALIALAALASLTDAEARGSSRLPGWTRGHVITHLARSADGVRACADAAARDQRGVQYPHGEQGRAFDIEAGARRPAKELLGDLRRAQSALATTWTELPDDAWDRVADALTGPRSIRELVVGRRRELLVHLVDLDVGVDPHDLPRDYLEDDAAWLAEFRPGWR